VGAGSGTDSSTAEVGCFPGICGGKPEQIQPFTEVAEVAKAPGVQAAPQPISPYPEMALGGLEAPEALEAPGPIVDLTPPLASFPEAAGSPGPIVDLTPPLVSSPEAIFPGIEATESPGPIVHLTPPPASSPEAISPETEAARSPGPIVNLTPPLTSSPESPLPVIEAAGSSEPIVNLPQPLSPSSGTPFPGLEAEAIVGAGPIVVLPESSVALPATPVSATPTVSEPEWTSIPDSEVIGGR